jgi:hypothetical protein
MSNILRPISSIAYDIQKEWGEKIRYSAKPYLSAMQGFNSISDHYGYDSARSIVLYFLGNASTFRGEKAKALKQELKNHLNQKG